MYFIRTLMSKLVIFFDNVCRTYSEKGENLSYKDEEMEGDFLLYLVSELTPTCCRQGGTPNGHRKHVGYFY